MIATVAALVLFSPLVDDPPIAKEPPSKEVLAAITERGRLLAGYDKACWHATDAVVARKPKEGSVVRYIARKTDAGWTVAFGKLDDQGDKFLVAYEAIQGKDPKTFEVQAHDPPKADDGFLKAAAKAIDTALKEFRPAARRPYNVAILPAEKDEFWVYVVPAPTKAGVWPVGGDARYRVSADGSKVVETRQMHKAIIEQSAPPAEDGAKAVAGLHSHVLSDVPEDSDVFLVLSRTPAVPEYVSSQRFVFLVEVDGTIRYMGRPDELQKKK